DRLIVMIRRLLDLNAIEMQTISLNPEPTDIGSCLNTVADSFASEAKKKKISISVHTISGKYFATLDRNYLVNIYENLISNAIKFSKHNKNITLRNYMDGDNILTVIEDEGPGISKEDMEKMYGKFQKLSARPTGDESSSGLGLSIAKKYTEVMNGTINCESIVGEGTRFIISFKALKIKNEA
ncbi:MAG: HAMP domain-containing histidine kinase, partial [Cyclobacteriaceae bacterium]|nr:HAMP domain-containing histidine kinase [Cyclobacteriaceae bacterium]